MSKDKVDGPMYMDIRPSPYGYALSLTALLVMGDQVAQANARAEIVRLLSALWRNDYDFVNNRWWDSKTDMGRGPTYREVFEDEYPWS